MIESFPYLTFSTVFDTVDYSLSWCLFFLNFCEAIFILPFFYILFPLQSSYSIIKRSSKWLGKSLFIYLYIHSSIILPSIYLIYPTHTKVLLIAGIVLDIRAIIDNNVDISRGYPQVRDISQNTINCNIGFCQDSIQTSNLFILYNHLHNFIHSKIHLQNE